MFLEEFSALFKALNFYPHFLQRRQFRNRQAGNSGLCYFLRQSILDVVAEMQHENKPENNLRKQYGNLIHTPHPCLFPILLFCFNRGKFSHRLRFSRVFFSFPFQYFSASEFCLSVTEPFPVHSRIRNIEAILPHRCPPLPAFRLNFILPSSAVSRFFHNRNFNDALYKPEVRDIKKERLSQAALFTLF